MFGWLLLVFMYLNQELKTSFQKTLFSFCRHYNIKVCPLIVYRISSMVYMVLLAFLSKNFSGKRISIHGIYDFVSLFIQEHFRDIMKFFYINHIHTPWKIVCVITDLFISSIFDFHKNSKNFYIDIHDFKNSRAEVVFLIYDVKRGCEVCGEQITHDETRR